MIHQQPVYIEEYHHGDWEVQEHVVCCSDAVAICGHRFQDLAPSTVSESEDDVECRVCFAIYSGEFDGWRCPRCGCSIHEECDHYEQ